MPKRRIFATRTLPVPVELVFEDESGKRVSEKFTVRYKSYSTTVLDEVTALEKNADGTTSFSAYLAAMVTSIVDADAEELVSESGKTCKDGREFFDAMALRENVKTLYDAIEADIAPPQPSPGGGQDG